MSTSLAHVSIKEVDLVLKVLEHYGVKLEHLAMILVNESYARKVALAFRQGETAGVIHYRVAQQEMGANFFGPAEWSDHYGLQFSKGQLRKIAGFPYSIELLNSPCPFNEGKLIKETHFAFLGLDRFKDKPLTIMEWQKIHPALGQPRFYDSVSYCWYAKDDFCINEVLRFRWYLVLIKIVPNSESMIFEEQLRLLPEAYCPLRAIEEVTKAMLFFKKNGIYLNQYRYACCSSLASNGDQVRAGRFNSLGLSIYYRYGNDRDDKVGVGAVRK